MMLLQKSGDDDQALDRSRGGFGTKVHIGVEALGNPVRLILIGGQVGDAPQGTVLVDGIEAEHDDDRHLYKERNLVERLINRARQCRRIATRYEKTAGNYLAFWQ